MLSRKLWSWIGAGVVSVALVPAGFAHVRVRHTATNSKIPAKTAVVATFGKPSNLKTSGLKTAVLKTSVVKTSAKVPTHTFIKTTASKSPVRHLTALKPKTVKTTATKIVARKGGVSHSLSNHVSTFSHRLPLHRTTGLKTVSRHPIISTAKKATLTSATKRSVSNAVVKTAAMTK